MEENLMFTIAKDTRIKPYDGESQGEYLGRLVYSSMGQWLKVITLDTGNLDGAMRTKNKSYVLSRGTEILNNMILAMPECREWFWNSYNESKRKEEHPVRILRERMLNAGELIETDLKTNIGTPREYKKPFIENYERILGLGSSINSNELYIGVTRIKKSSTAQREETAIINSCKIFNWVKRAAKWETINDLFKYEFFQSLSKSAPYKSWINIFPNVGAKNIVLGRVKLYNDLYEYYLFKMEENQIYIYKLSTVLNEFKEERRIILALRKISGNVMKAKAELKKEVVILKLFCRLPLVEERIFETYCWPKKCINDKINYVIPIQLWNHFKMILEELQIEIKE
ncbi:hypothetical protein OSC52_16690 [Clostridium pasteurianum]|uniref:hypothetical protein n=1 Tax=Clostridium pasteurianum TaxID=1501 RepID=UPI002260E7E1|nr:hypothetical protein [Clostridium pasteurianum]UZW13460.1 hypothetical protein OSC52_16690 [Clostridium pasteurianum]